MWTERTRSRSANQPISQPTAFGFAIIITQEGVSKLLAVLLWKSLGTVSYHNILVRRLFALSLKTLKITTFGRMGLPSSSGKEVGDTYFVGSNRLGYSRSSVGLLLFPWTWPVIQYSKIKATRFGSWLCFRLHVKIPVPILLGPTEGASPNHQSPRNLD
jgi:hypothetical protein